MGMWKRRIPLLAAVLVSVALAAAAYAELPPGSYERLKTDAQEKLKIKILTVEKKTQGERRLDVQFTAEVFEVERSRSGLRPGDTIQIKSYHWTKGYVGPKNPPLLPVGWIGIAYLNKADGSGKNRIYTLAAYGDSFEEGR
jgi:hypothetical protein